MCTHIYLAYDLPTGYLATAYGLFICRLCLHPQGGHPEHPDEGQRLGGTGAQHTGRWSRLQTDACSAVHVTQEARLGAWDLHVRRYF